MGRLQSFLSIIESGLRQVTIYSYISYNIMEYVLKINHVMISNTGWWYTYPSETYESQLGCLLPISGKNVPNHQPDICFYHQSLHNYEEIVTINDSQNTHMFNMAHKNATNACLSLHGFGPPERNIVTCTQYGKIILESMY